MIKIFVSILGTSLIYLIASLLNIRLSIPLMVGIVYVLPILLNIGLELAYHKSSTVKSQLCLSAITTAGYVIFSLLLMHNAGFHSFIVNNSVTAGDMYLSIDPNLVGFSQLIFVLLLNFAAQYLTHTLMKARP